MLGIVEFETLDAKQGGLEGMELRDKGAIFGRGGTALAQGVRDCYDELEGRDEVTSRESEADGHWERLGLVKLASK